MTLDTADIWPELRLLLDVLDDGRVKPAKLATIIVAVVRELDMTPEEFKRAYNGAAQTLENDAKDKATQWN